MSRIALVVVAIFAAAGCAGPQAQARATSASPTAAVARPKGFEGSFADKQHQYSLRCLREAGWQVELDPATGAIASSVSREQQSAWMAASDKCSTEAEAKFPSPKLDTADFKALYRMELETARCLEKEGFPQSREPISEQQYVDDYAAGRGPSWFAYEAVGYVTPELEKKCPQPMIWE